MKMKKGAFAIRYDLLRRSMAKRAPFAMVALGVIALFEIVMIVRALIVFDFTIPAHVAYFCLYWGLLVVCLLGLIVLLRIRLQKRNEAAPWELACAYLVIAAIAGWATAVAALDLIGGGTAIVFLTVMVAIPFFIVTDFYYYSGVLLLAMASLFLFPILAGHYFNDGSIINLLVYFLICLLVGVASYRQTTETLNLEKTLSVLASTDGLTGANNRRSFDERVDALQKSGMRYVIIFLDIDRFKNVNDFYGHAFGDTCLCDVADLLKSKFGGENVYRYGGDEFAGVSQKDLGEVEKLIQEINDSLQKEHPRADLTVSAGLYLSEKGEDPRQVFIKVDKALYKAKQDKDLTWVVYDDKE